MSCELYGQCLFIPVKLETNSYQINFYQAGALQEGRAFFGAAGSLIADAAAGSPNACCVLLSLNRKMVIVEPLSEGGIRLLVFRRELGIIEFSGVPNVSPAVCGCSLFLADGAYPCLGRGPA